MERLRRKVRVACVAAVAGAGLSLLGSPARCQEPLPRRARGAYVELGGNSLMGVNYEQFLSPRVSVRVGGGVIPMVGGVSALAMVNYVGGHKHQVEVGTGILAGRGSMGTWYPLSTSLVGYRYQADNGFLLRAGVALDIGARTDGGRAAALIPAFSLGRSF